MLKSELLQLIDSFDFSKKEYYVLGVASLVIRGIREETKDLDLCISKKLFCTIREKYNLNDSCKNEKGFYRLSFLVEVVVEGVYPFEFDIVDGYPVQKLNFLLKNKEQSVREKDKKDVELIKKFINKEQCV